MLQNSRSIQIKTAIIFQEKYLNKKQLKIMDTINKPNKCLLVVQLCPTVCDPIDCSLPGSSVHGILQARILEWIAIPFSKASSHLRDWTWVSYIAGRFFTIELLWKPSLNPVLHKNIFWNMWLNVTLQCNDLYLILMYLILIWYQICIRY